MHSDLFEEKYLYLVLNGLAIAGPLALSFHPRSKFYKTWPALFPAMLIIAAIFIIWDIFFTKMGVWGFNERYLSGLYLVNLPIEECLFFISVPYACLFSYHSVKVLTRNDFAQKTASWTTPTLLIFLASVGIFTISRWYTSITFLALFAFIILLSKKTFLPRFYFTYLLILFPFFLMNGVLTGMGIEEEVVWYNNQENIGIRLITIPIEDIFYGMLLILLNVCLYEYFLFLQKNKHQYWKKFIIHNS